MCLTPNDNMVEAFMADRPDRTFDVSILPGDRGACQNQTPMDQSRAAKKPQPSEQSKVVRRDDHGLSAYFLLASTQPCEPIHVACVW